MGSTCRGLIAVGKDLEASIHALVEALKKTAATPKMVAALISRLESEIGSVREAAAKALGQIEEIEDIAATREVFTALIQCLEDKNSYVRSSAANALGKTRGRMCAGTALTIFELAHGKRPDLRKKQNLWHRLLRLMGKTEK